MTKPSVTVNMGLVTEEGFNLDMLGQQPFDPQDPREVFDLKGLKVVEIIRELRDGRRWICWCLYPFDKMTAAGRQNPLVYLCYPNSMEAAFQARETIRQAFLKYHGLE